MELGNFSDPCAPVDTGPLADRPYDALVRWRWLGCEPGTDSSGGYGGVDLVLVDVCGVFDVGNPVTSLNKTYGESDRDEAIVDIGRNPVPVPMAVEFP